VTAIFDEGVPHDLLAELHCAGCDVVGFPKGWKGTKNGQLLKLIAAGGFTCLITSDKDLPHQQNLPQVSFAIVVLPSNNLDDLRMKTELIYTSVTVALPGAATWVD